MCRIEILSMFFFPYICSETLLFLNFFIFYFSHWTECLFFCVVSPMVMGVHNAPVLWIAVMNGHLNLCVQQCCRLDSWKWNWLGKEYMHLLILGGDALSTFKCWYLFIVLSVRVLCFKRCRSSVSVCVSLCQECLLECLRSLELDFQMPVRHSARVSRTKLWFSGRISKHSWLPSRLSSP